MSSSPDTNLKDWQLDMLDKYKGKGVVMMTGRNHGKSNFPSQAFHRLWQDIMASKQPVEALLLDVGTVYGSRYYTVEPVGGSWLEMESWCADTFGPCGPRGDKNAIWDQVKAPEPAQRWYMNNRKFWFREVKDRDWFVIRWNA